MLADINRGKTPHRNVDGGCDSYKTTPFFNSTGQTGERQVVAMVMGVLPAKGSSPYKADIQRGAEEETCESIRPKATLN